MKRKTGITLTIIILGFVFLLSFAIAQEMKDKPNRDVQRPMGLGMARMGGTGMRGMGPMHRQGAGGSGPMGMMHRRGMMGNPDALMRLADKLELSEGQRNEIKDMFTTHRKDMIRRNADLELAQVELQELMSQDKPDLGAIKEKINHIAALEAEVKFSQVKLQIEAKNVLTEDQQEKLKDLVKNGRGQMMRERMRMGRPEKPDSDREDDDD